MVCIYSTSGGRVFLNINNHVGFGRPNRLDDVELVRFGYFATRASSHPSGAEVRQALAGPLAAVSPAGPFGPDLDAMIRAHQKFRGGTQDGCVSPIHGSTADYGPITFMLVGLNNNMCDLMPGIYPRIDQSPQSGAAVSQAVRAMFVPKS